ncbi:MAG: zf-HC2 domain-containing protein [Acidobacteria bacterium]|nr:zf-HC2 domain-containing protein [Acidobacteriota bacterium]
MRSALKAALSQHPSAADLARFGDNELGGSQRRRVARHVEECARCRQEVGQIGESLELLLANAAPAPDAVELRATLGQVIEKVRLIEGNVPAAVWQQVVKELEAHLGDFAGVLGEESSHDPSRLLENAGPLLASFLGADAAAAVESRIRRLLETCLSAAPGQAERPA